MDIYAIVGAGGFGREVMPLAAAELSDARLVFVDDRLAGTSVNGFDVIAMHEFTALSGERLFNIAIADGAVRESIAENMIAAGAKPFSVSAANALDLSHNEIGEGAIMCPFTMVTANAKIGRFFHANIYSYVAHDCVIGDFVTFAPNVHCNGSVVIEDHAYIGTGAIIRNGSPDRPIVIGRGAIVGMGSVVTKNVEPHTTVCGNPARPIQRAG